MLMNLWKITYILLLLPVLVFAQPTNDDCTRPYTLPDVTKYCSKSSEFTIVGATPSGYGPATCWRGTSNDVWFRFKAFFTEVSISIIGSNHSSGGAAGGSLRAPQVALYAGFCGGTISELECKSDAGTNGAISIIQGGLTVGEDYLIRVDGSSGATGSFQICLNNYNPPVSPGQDCNTGSILCDKSPFVTQKLSGPGRILDEASLSCLGETSTASEQQSAWYTWVAKTNGTLTFKITPLTPGEDMDFALYELPTGIRTCSDKKLLRCNATAPPCGNAITGLDLTSTDISENFNCNAGEDGFCKYIDMVQGKAYTLIINNFSNSGSGFAIEWGGTGEFQGPTAAFAIIPPSGLRCETDFVVTDSSVFTNGRILSYSWNFGKDAIPATSKTKGPHTVNYSSFGEKYITLTIETDLGCQVTEIRRLFAEPCCEDLPNLGIRLDSAIDVRCFKSKDGVIQVSGIAGNPYIDNNGASGSAYYMYSIDGISYSPLNKFTKLPAGTYTIYIQDRKGCQNRLNVTIGEPLEIIPDVGLDKEIELGETIDLATQVLPPDNYAFRWLLGDSIVCRTCGDTKAVPLNDGYFKVRATDYKGCYGEDSLFIIVRKYYDLWAPNVISANYDNLNDKFKLFGKNSIKEIQSLKIYDRWGELLYQGNNIDLNDANAGWDGTFRGKQVMTGVYVYAARVKYIDGKVIDKAGEFTLIR